MSLAGTTRKFRHVRVMSPIRVHPDIRIFGESRNWHSLGEVAAGPEPHDLLFFSPLLRRRKRDKRPIRLKFVNKINGVP